MGHLFKLEFHQVRIICSSESLVTKPFFLNLKKKKGGLFTGADGSKSIAERALFGGIANAPYDPCYHQACDTVDNIDQVILLQMSQASAYILQTLADKANLRSWLQQP